jgi:hypothetical protein
MADIVAVRVPVAVIDFVAVLVSVLLDVMERV